MSFQLLSRQLRRDLEHASGVLQQLKTAYEADLRSAAEIPGCQGYLTAALASDLWGCSSGPDEVGSAELSDLPPMRATGNDAGCASAFGSLQSSQTSSEALGPLQDKQDPLKARVDDCSVPRFTSDSTAAASSTATRRPVLGFDPCSESSTSSLLESQKTACFTVARRVTGLDVRLLSMLEDILESMDGFQGLADRNHRDICEKLAGLQAAVAPVPSAMSRGSSRSPTRLVSPPDQPRPNSLHSQPTASMTSTASFRPGDDLRDDTSFDSLNGQVPVGGLSSMTMENSAKPETPAIRPGRRSISIRPHRSGDGSIDFVDNMCATAVLRRADWNTEEDCRASWSVNKRLWSSNPEDQRGLALVKHTLTFVLPNMLRHGAKTAVSWVGFDRVVGFVILVNAVCIGVEINLDLRGDLRGTVKHAMQVSEYVFLAIYILELSLRLYADRLRALTNNWVIFDCVLILVGLSIQVSDALTVLGKLAVFRMARLLRMVRAVRLLKQFRTLWQLVSGLLTSCDAILSTLAIVLLVIYIASCVGVELITLNASLQRSPTVARVVDEHFSSLGGTMLTLVRFVTMDDLADIYEPIIVEQPLFLLYFVALLMIIPIALLNLITAVLVEGALEKGRKDKEMMTAHLRQKVKKDLPIARDLFRALDTSEDGLLTLNEIRIGLTTGSRAIELGNKLKRVIPFDSVFELFEALDVDGDGEITEDEFLEGVLKATLEEGSSPELFQVLRLVRIIARKIDRQAITSSVGLPSGAGEIQARDAFVKSPLDEFEL